MKIYLHEIKEQDTQLDFTQDESWVCEAVSRVNESPEPGESRPTAAQRPVSVHFNLHKVDNVVVISGDIEADVQLLCSRCAAPFAFHTEPSFSALFCQDPDMAGIAHLNESRQPVGQNRGFARHAHDESRDLDITYLSEDYVDLASVITEQLQLQVPFQPLCKESCKGVCAHCGADFNVGRCACAKLNPTHPFAALQKLKIDAESLNRSAEPKKTAARSRSAGKTAEKN